MKRLGENLKLVLKRFDWSADDFGRRLGMGRGAAKNWVLEKSEPSLDKLIQIERMTGVGISRLVFGEMDFYELPLEPLPGWREATTVSDELLAVAEDAPAYVPPAPEALPLAAALVDISALVAEVAALRADRERDRGRIEELEGLVMGLMKASVPPNT
jgi:transcriptional regulator with XRE-family HTH domain